MRIRAKMLNIQIGLTELVGLTTAINPGTSYRRENAVYNRERTSVTVNIFLT